MPSTWRAEGAVSSALEASAQILIDHGETEPLPAVQIPPEWPRALLVFAQIIMVPVVAVARVIAWFEEIFFPHRPDASDVRIQATPRLADGLTPTAETVVPI